MAIADELPIRFVSDNAEFNDLCDALAGEEILALDTEFVRTSTFYPRIGLIQIANDSVCYLVDPLEIDDWSRFKDLLNNPDCMFVIHSCGEDLNLLHTSLQCVPARVFDTQLAAAFLGFGFSLSYQALSRELLNVEIDKDETRSDWTKRPLTDRQISYAAADVEFLIPLQKLLSQGLQDKNRLQWFELECSYQLSTASQSEQSENWENLYTGISNAWRLNDAGLSYLQKLCYWREQEARRRDRPRSWVAKDGDLLSIASGLAASGELSPQALKTIEGADRRLLERYGDKFLTLLSDQSSAFTEIDRQRLSTPLGPALRKKLKSCQRVVNEKAEQLGMAPELLGRKRRLLELVRSFDQSGEISWTGDLSSWRREVLEPDIRLVMTGEN